MSRVCYNGAGVDNTAALKTFLASTKNPLMKFLYLIGRPEDPNAIWLTDHEAPLTYLPVGRFYPAVVSKSKLTFKVGTETQDCTVTWAPSNRNFTASNATAAPMQIAAHHGYDMWPVRIWKVYMPTPGDCNTIGAVEWFAGVVSTAKVSRAGIEFKVKNFAYVLSMKLPSAVVEVTNSLGAYTAATPPAGSNVPVFNVFTGSTETVIYGDLTDGSGTIFSGGLFDNGYMVFLNIPGATLGGAFCVVGASGEYSDGDGNHHNVFDVYGGLPWPPTPGLDKFFVSKAAPVNLGDEDYYGFPFVPNPESAA